MLRLGNPWRPFTLIKHGEAAAKLEQYIGLLVSGEAAPPFLRDGAATRQSSGCEETWQQTSPGRFPAALWQILLRQLFGQTTGVVAATRDFLVKVVVQLQVADGGCDGWVMEVMLLSRSPSSPLQLDLGDEMWQQLLEMGNKVQINSRNSVPRRQG